MLELIKDNLLFGLIIPIAITMIIGLIFKFFIPDDLLKRYKITHLKNVRKRVDNNLKTWLLDYYDRKNGEKIIYELHNNLKIPYLSKPSWFKQSDSAREVHFFLDNAVKEDIKEDIKIIKNRKMLGQKITNNEIWSLKNIDENSDSNVITISMKKSRYNKYITIADKLALEAERCQRMGFFLKPKVRNKRARTLLDLLLNKPGVQIIGFSVACVFHFNNKYEVLIHRRSYDTAIGGGKMSVIPSYVCEPTPTGVDYKDNVPFELHYFLKEFSEEIYNQNELQDNGNIANHRWFYEMEPTKSLLESYGTGFKFQILGLGFDAITTELNIAAVAYLNESKISYDLRGNSSYNWEFGKDRDDVYIYRHKFIKLGTEEFDELLSRDDLYHTSAFTLDCLQKRFYSGYEPFK